VSIPEPDLPGEWRLHNVVTDPGVANDPSTQMPERLETLGVAWEQYASEVGVLLGEQAALIDR
jgi:hypothetical protein